MTRPTRFHCCLILLASALVLRAGVLWLYGDQLTQDVDGYRALAENLVAGRGYVWPASQAPTAFRPPLYPLVIAGVLALGLPLFTLGILHALCGLATVWLTVRVGQNLSLGRFAWLAGALVAVDPLLLRNTTLMMTETLAALLTVAWLWWIVRIVGRADRAVRGRTAFVLGVVFGLCCLCRPTYWAVGGLAAMVMAGRAYWLRRQRAVDGGQRATSALWRPAGLVACGVAGVALVVGPWVGRNAIVLGAPVLTTTHGGYTLLLAHNPVYQAEVVEQRWGTVWGGASLRAWQAELEREMAAADPPVVGELARDRWMSRRAWEHIGQDPVGAVRVAGTLVGRLWNVVPLGEGGENLPRLVRWGIGAFYTVVLLSALAGGIVVLRRREVWSGYWPLLVLIVAVTAVHTLYWADMRMRAPLMPAVALLAARGWAWWHER